jgi:phosphatidylinositol alpha-1,6-mannosyltransferase
MLDVVGDGRLRPSLESLACAIGIDGAAVFHGRLSDEERDAVLAEGSVFAMPSRVDAFGSSEGFGIAYVEAGGRGLPVVAGRVAGALDAVVDGETGLLVDSRDHVQVAEALVLLLRDHDLARRLGDGGWARAKTLTWERAAREVENVLDEAVSM